MAPRRVPLPKRECAKGSCLCLLSTAGPQHPRVWSAPTNRWHLFSCFRTRRRPRAQRRAPRPPHCIETPSRSPTRRSPPVDVRPRKFSCVSSPSPLERPSTKPSSRGRVVLGQRTSSSAGPMGRAAAARACEARGRPRAGRPLDPPRGERPSSTRFPARLAETRETGARPPGDDSTHPRREETRPSDANANLTSRRPLLLAHAPRSTHAHQPRHD